uniref:Carboxylic ester hydrolase n=1 Tax=Glyphodes pyloalis TaxID=1242752 RepID=A0A5J6BTH0_GLYPY|nr:acetylcholinesterase-like protein [Glyphodes pyloalis]
MVRAEYIVPVLLCVCYGASGLPRIDPLVETKVGLIRGLTADNGDYSMFLGIPYATVDPLNPFGPSSPHPGFDTTFDAIDDSVVCPQLDEDANNTLVGSIDCLNLHVYVPNTASSRNPRPVMVWIHGGAFIVGSGGRYDYGPRFLVRHDVIVVTVNYRLGAYGFLCPDIPEVPGNQGIKDQLTALRWVKNNIDAFGGDSNQITLFGESAGAITSDFLLIYTKEILFNNLILQSGTALKPLAAIKPNPSVPLKLAKHLGFVTDNVHDALQFLRTVDSNLVVAATLETNVQTRPCLENEYDNVERLITSLPVDMKIEKARSVPILVGFNDNERGLLYENVKTEDFKNLNPFKEISNIHDFDDEYFINMVVDIVRQFYIGDENVSEDVKDSLIDFDSDLSFYHSTLRSIEKYFENGASNIYFYVFSYDGDRNFVKRKTNANNISGAAHADELGYLFDVVTFDETPTPEDQLIIDRITTLWTNFAKYSNPTPETSDLLPVQWPAATRDTLYYFDIDSEVSIKKRPYHERMAFWELLHKLHQSYLKGTQEN